MKLISTKFNGLKVVQSKNFTDSRGFFKENFKQFHFKKIKFVFGCISSSKKGVLRGMHMQTKFSQGKYVSVIKGSILDVVVDLRKNSKTFGKHYKIILSDKNAKSVSKSGISGDPKTDVVIGGKNISLKLQGTIQLGSGEGSSTKDI